MKRTAKNHNRTRSLQSLVRIALRHRNTDEGWLAIAELHRRGSPQTLAIATALARSPTWRRRSLGLHIASQLRRRSKGSTTEYALEQTQEMLIAGLHDQHEEVVLAAVSGLGHRPHPDALMDLVRLSSHRDDQLRWNVAVSLGRYEDPLALGALLRLMADPDDDVRDWATFGVGSLQSSDMPEVRAALWKNLGDVNDYVRGEALVGLAERQAPRVVEFLLKHLDPECRVCELDAAGKLANPKLLEPLRAIARVLSEDEVDGHWFNCLQRAIAACSVAADARV